MPRQKHRGQVGFKGDIRTTQFELHKLPLWIRITHIGEENIYFTWPGGVGEGFCKCL